MVPDWLQTASIGMLALGVGCAIYMATVMLRHPPKMAVMRFVWPLCALFAGPLLIWFYRRYAAPGTGDAPFPATVA